MTTTAYPHIDAYHAELRRLIEYGGSDNESQIRSAFSRCLDEYCRSHHDKLALVEELPFNPRVTPDGTVKDSLRLARGYWEAKDTRDNLEKEIQNKLNRGYPRDNIIFEDSRMAVLYQNGDVAMRVNMAETPNLDRLIRQFLDYELPEIEDFRKAQRQFSDDLPAVLAGLRETIEVAERTNTEYRAKATDFLEHCRRTIGLDISEADVREMLLQHILTKDIFLRVFAEDQFHSENTIANELNELESTFFVGDVRRNSIARLRSYYGAIARAADSISDFQEKQTFLKGIYGDFYKAYNPGAADRLGIVYTPNEIVDFMIRGTDHLLRVHFGRSLADENVEILDPATGTGTFVTSLIDYLPRDRVEYKYHNEIHANEVAILPYYIANLNIEYTYKERMGQYSRFPGLAFVDTLDNMDWQEGEEEETAEQQPGFNLGGLSVDNWMRIQEQNSRKISVIIGNPPYNDSQANWNDFNPNRSYDVIDKRIQNTYVKHSKAQRSHQYDMYKRFVRWASDRLADEGIIAFVTNRSYLDKYQEDGFRRQVQQEFSHVYAIDLGGDIRDTAGAGNVFGIMAGIALSFFVRTSERLGDLTGTSIVNYHALDNMLTGEDKLSALREIPLDRIAFERITPDTDYNWLNQSVTDFGSLLPAANRATKRAKSLVEENAIFGTFTNAAKSNRTDWVYDFDAISLAAKARFFAAIYNKHINESIDGFSTEIKWSRDLRDQRLRRRTIEYSENKIIEGLFRPFVLKRHFSDFVMNDVLTVNHFEMFGADLRSDNIVICFEAPTIRRPFGVIATDLLPEYHLFFDGTQTLPLYSYEEDGTQVSNITDWGLRQFRDHYGDDSITAEQIFAYTYAVLHDPVYREKYTIDLTREFPRLPFHESFDQWAEHGQELLDLHIGFESVEPYPLKRIDKVLTGRRAGSSPKALLRADKEKGIINLDERTSLQDVPKGVWDYRLGNRSAVEWVLDQYKEKTPRDPTIRDHFNTYKFADYKEKVIDLLQRVTTISLRTNEIVETLAGLSKLNDTAED